MISTHLHKFLFPLHSKEDVETEMRFRTVLKELCDAVEEGSSCLPLEESQIARGDLLAALDSEAEGSVVGSPGSHQPLILTEKEKLYLNRYFTYESEISTHLRTRLEVEGSPPAHLENHLAALFPDDEEGDQTEAARKAATETFSIISGGPGTGKTTTVLKILKLLQRLSFFSSPEDVLLLAPTGKAADRLRQSLLEGIEREKIDGDHSLPTETSTIHRALGWRPQSIHFQHDARNPLSARVVVVDESSMVALPLMAKLIRAIPSDAKLILLGDQHQLTSVEVGSVLADLIQSHLDASSPLHKAVTILKKSYRNQGSIHTACEAIKKGEAETFFSAIQDGGDGLVSLSDLPVSLRASLEPLVKAHWLPVLQDSTLTLLERLQRIDDFRVLTPRHHGQMGIDSVNATVETILRENGIDSTETWYEGRSVIVSENDPSLGVYNGDTGLCVRDENGDRRVAFFSDADPDHPDGLRLLSPTILPAVKTAWALTIHRTQGSEYKNLLLILPPHTDSDQSAPEQEKRATATRELFYTGLSRTKEQAQIWSTPETLTRIIQTPATRASGLKDLL